MTNIEKTVKSVMEEHAADTPPTKGLQEWAAKRNSRRRPRWTVPVLAAACVMGIAAVIFSTTTFSHPETQATSPAAKSPVSALASDVHSAAAPVASKHSATERPQTAPGQQKVVFERLQILVPDSWNIGHNSCKGDPLNNVVVMYTLTQVSSGCGEVVPAHVNLVTMSEIGASSVAADPINDRIATKSTILDGHAVKVGHQTNYTVIIIPDLNIEMGIRSSNIALLSAIYQSATIIAG